MTTRQKPLQPPFKETLIEHLQHLVFFLEMHEENPFKIRAFANAAETLEGLENDDLVAQVKSGTLTELKGIGKGTLTLAKQVLDTGNSDELEKAVQGFPMTLIELRPVKGLGPKRIAQLWKDLGIKTLGELEYACTENRLSAIKGMGPKIQTKVLEQIQAIKSRQGKVLLCDAVDSTADILAQAARLKIGLFASGDLGRRSEIVEQLRLILAADSVKIALDLIDKLPVKEFSANKNSSEIRAHLKSGVQTIIEVVPSSTAGAALVKATSSEVHWKSLEARAAKQKLKIEKIEATTDQEFYKALKVKFHPPEARELDIAESEGHEFLEVSDLTGVFHLHTIASDGLNSLEEMAQAAASRGWSYMGLSDHSQTAFYARGLTDKMIKEQHGEISAISKTSKNFEILKGIESDILKDGALDYPVSTLKSLDFVIASIHSRYGMTEMTDRLIAAIENPYTSMIGHISGRLLLAREAYSYDVDKIIAAAIKHNRVIELNANPHRLDMDWKSLRLGAKKGLLISINPDAHSTSGFDHVKYGVWMANKALFPKEQVINTWPLPKIKKFLQSQR